MQEFRESIKIVREVLDGLPEGPISSRPGVKSVGQVRVPKGEGYARVEGARGEVGCYIISDGGPKPYRMKWRRARLSIHLGRPQAERGDHGAGRGRTQVPVVPVMRQGD